MILNHSIVFSPLLFVGLIYYRLAKKFNIVDKPNQRRLSFRSEPYVAEGISFRLLLYYFLVVVFGIFT